MTRRRRRRPRWPGVSARGAVAVLEGDQIDDEVGHGVAATQHVPGLRVHKAAQVALLGGPGDGVEGTGGVEAGLGHILGKPGDTIMAHHKRRRPKNGRAGCLLCKPWKANGFARGTRSDGERFSDHRRRALADRQRRTALYSR